jgi:RimJ/RimL family protein N-acetyltransferase
MGHEHWPLFELRVQTPRIELRYPDDDDVMALADLAASGIHDPSTMPFLFPWTDVEPPLLQRNAIQHFWRRRAEWDPRQWSLLFATVVDGDLVGVQEINAGDFLVCRTVGTGSWLGRAHQGRGIGREMRAAVLHFAFAGLGAQRAESAAFTDNPASLAVSRALGYREKGLDVVARRDEPATLVRLVVDHADWLPNCRDDIEIVGLRACRPLFGLAS